MYPDQPYGDQEPGQAYYEEMPPGHTQPYPPQPASLRLSDPAPAPRRAAPWLAVACCVVSIASLALAAAALTFTLQYRSTAQGQIRELQTAVSNAQAGSQANASSLGKQASKLSAINAALAAIAQFDTVCSTDLTGPSGPAQWDFMCKLHPGG
jgi:hypothetical protein